MYREGHRLSLGSGILDMKEGTEKKKIRAGKRQLLHKICSPFN